MGVNENGAHRYFKRGCGGEEGWTRKLRFAGSAQARYSVAPFSFHLEALRHSGCNMRRSNGDILPGRSLTLVDGCCSRNPIYTS
ncbi:hypothetical protein V2G26_003878 [Clonostachys chloroleuca]